MVKVDFKPLLDALKRAKKEGRTTDPHGLPIVLVYDDLKETMASANNLVLEDGRVYPNIVFRGTIIGRSNTYIRRPDLNLAILKMAKTINEASYQVKPLHEAIRDYRESVLKKIEDVLLVGDESADHYLHELTASLIRFSSLIKEHYSSDLSSKLP